jgi:4-hydroxy 2-oxovalerate aldolase
MNRVDVMDTTLRDGSYAVDFAFTGEDTATICGELEAAGFRYIEIGHGLGLRASESGHGRARATDEDYLRAARGALHHAAFGMFCIPRIARLDDVDLAADEGAGFIRIGTDVTATAESQPYIHRAKRRGMLVTANLMKSYAVPARRFADAVRRSADYGADVVYLVDSAGCMSPEDVAAYFAAVRDVSDVPMGFHGHDNLGMAVYNSLRMADDGAILVDASLQGLGRSAGNAVTEILVAALQKRGYATGIDLLRTLHVGYTHVRPHLRRHGITPLDVVTGYAGFHSSFLPKVLQAAERHRLDPAQLIIELCKVDQVEVKDETLLSVATRLGNDATVLADRVPGFGGRPGDAPRAGSGVDASLPVAAPPA